MVLEPASIDQKEKKKVMFYCLECSRTELVLVSGQGWL